MSPVTTQGSQQLVNVNWSPRALVPMDGTVNLPMPWSSDFEDRVRGRSGDLVVVQVKSSIARKSDQRGALKTLGLNGVRSASLRHSDDPSTWGSIQLVRHLVAVIELPGMYYRQGRKTETPIDKIDIESLEYGTKSRPGQLWRNSNGEYFGYESTRDLTVAYWSSNIDLLHVVNAIEHAGLEIDNSGSSSLITIPASDAGTSNSEYSADSLEEHEGPWAELVRAHGTDQAYIAVIKTKQNLEVTWRSPYARFDDMDTIRAEASCIAQPLDILAVRALSRLTGDQEFLQLAEPRIKAKLDGKRREYRI